MAVSLLRLEPLATSPYPLPADARWRTGTVTSLPGPGLLGSVFTPPPAGSLPAAHGAHQCPTNSPPRTVHLYFSDKNPARQTGCPAAAMMDESGSVGALFRLPTGVTPAVE